ncbi:RING-H2 finger protein ATL3-like [Solanum pennellii]|uniref:RING-type E3 ubiquitin transferase n=1 Tax=Solanum pennellii TaxID=28526 RepID=A0ABM1H0T9_SOLPN|nr:RING-H2 finger protein ATL3-like [Solanum pennellii]
MADVLQNNGKLDDPSMIELTGKILVVAVIVLFLVLMLVFFLHLYSKWFWNQRRQADNHRNAATRQRRRRRRFDFSPGHEVHVTSVLNRGLDPVLLKTIPVVLFDPEEFKDGLECAVCLCDVSEGEMARLLPKCNHGFHVDCIDMWLQSHSTCPLCRNPVMLQEATVETILRTPIEEEVINFPTNVLFWGNENQVSTMGSNNLEEDLQDPNSPPPPVAAPSSSSSLDSTSDRPCVSLIIDIPRQINEVVEEEEDKSPMPTRLRSLKRLLSRDNRVNPSSPRINVDIEQRGR